MDHKRNLTLTFRFSDSSNAAHAAWCPRRGPAQQAGKRACGAGRSAGARDRRRIANIPYIQHARPQNAAREPDTHTQLFCIVRSSLALLSEPLTFKPQQIALRIIPAIRSKRHRVKLTARPTTSPKQK